MAVELTVVERLRSLKNLKTTSVANKNAIEVALVQLENHQKLLDEKTADYERKVVELQKIQAELAKAEVKLETERVEANSQKQAFLAEIEDLLKVKAEYDHLLKEKVTSYTTEDISSFLNKTINDFNTNTESDSDVAKYIINNMDVDLKVRVHNDDDGDGKQSFKFVAPSINETGEDSLSSIKITIQAVPK